MSVQITRTEVGANIVSPSPTHSVINAAGPAATTPARTAVPRSQPGAGQTTVRGAHGDTASSDGTSTGATSPTSDQSNAGADAQALTGLLSLYQGAFGNGGQGGGAAAPGTLIASPATGGDTGDGSTSASLNLTTIVLAGIVMGAAYLVYRHFKKKGKTVAHAAGAL